MKLFYTLSSPYARTVRALIEEIGISDQIEMIETHPFDDDETFLQLSPLGKVPCLVGGGEIVVDSEVICDFLDATNTGGEMFNPVYADWRLKVLYAICSGLLDTCVNRRIEVLRDKEGIKSEFWWQRYQQAIERSLAHLESKLPLVPEEFCILHISLHTCLAYLDFRHPEIDWRQDYPGLADWCRQWESRSSLQATPLKA